MNPMNGRVIARWRMHSQHLWGQPLPTAEDVVARLGALQAQEYSVAKWSVAQRAGGTRDDDVERALAEGRILRTHVLRPTWHFVLPEDIRWMLELTAPRVRVRMAPADRRLELDGRLIARANRSIAKALEGGAHLTRKEVASVLERAGVPATGQRLGHLVSHAELDAVVCSGARRGKQHTYALLDERAPQAISLDRDRALAELARRYFATRGPATLSDFSWWSSLTAADCRAGVEMIDSELGHETFDRTTLWYSRSSAAPSRGRGGGVNLVQCYDESMIAYRETRDLLLDGLPPLMGQREGAMTHAVLLDGRLVGRWKPVPAKGSLVVEVSLDRSRGRPGRDALDRAAQAYGSFVGLPTVVRRV